MGMYIYPPYRDNTYSIYDQFCPLYLWHPLQIHGFPPPAIFGDKHLPSVGRKRRYSPRGLKCVQLVLHAVPQSYCSRTGHLLQ